MECVCGLSTQPQVDHNLPDIAAQRSMKRYLELFLIVIVAFSAHQFYYVWVVWKGFAYLELVAYSLEDRPYIYRLLVPVLSRALEWLTGIHAVYCMIFLFVLSAIGLFYSLRYLYTAFRRNDESALMFSFISCEFTFLLILIGVKVYDIATVMFFALSLGLLVRKKFNIYYILFIIASLNRETTFLLSLFFVVYFFNKLPFQQYFFGILYQGLAYMAVKTILMVVYAGIPGASLYLNPVGVIKGYMDKPVWFALLLLIFFCVFVIIALRQWSEKPLFLRVAFITIFPIQLILHILIGYPYEIRVFAEVFPVIFLLCAWSIPSIKYQPSLGQAKFVQ
jgi:hypothetical protein